MTRPSKAAIDIFNNLFQATAKGIKVEELSTDDIVVAVMGPTGSGKSSFIEIATGITGIAGHGLESCTNKISVIKLSFPGLDLCFVDTPGFDDTNRSDVDILKMISCYLISTYKRQIHLMGLLYFHRISDNRMAGTSLRNFHLFQQLCGESFDKIILTTTMWDQVEDDIGDAREKELKEVYWSPMIERGSTVKRFLYSRKSAFEILMPIFEEVQKRSALLLQTEMSDQGLRLRETSAGKALYVGLTELVARHQEILGKIRNDLKDQSVDQDQMQYLMDEYQQVSAQLQRATEDVRKMKLSAWRRLVRALPFKRKLREAKERARKERKERETWEARAKEWKEEFMNERERGQDREKELEEWKEREGKLEERVMELEKQLVAKEEEENEREMRWETNCKAKQWEEDKQILEAQVQALGQEVKMWQEKREDTKTAGDAVRRGDDDQRDAHGNDGECGKPGSSTDTRYVVEGEVEIKSVAEAAGQDQQKVRECEP